MGKQSPAAPPSSRRRVNGPAQRRFNGASATAGAESELTPPSRIANLPAFAGRKHDTGFSRQRSQYGNENTPTSPQRGRHELQGNFKIASPGAC